MSGIYHVHWVAIWARISPLSYGHFSWFQMYSPASWWKGGQYLSLAERNSGRVDGTWNSPHDVKSDRSQFAKIRHATFTNALPHTQSMYTMATANTSRLIPKHPSKRASTMSIPVALPRELRHHRPSSHASALGEPLIVIPLRLGHMSSQSQCQKGRFFPVVLCGFWCPTKNREKQFLSSHLISVGGFLTLNWTHLRSTWDFASC